MKKNKKNSEARKKLSLKDLKKIKGGLYSKTGSYSPPAYSTTGTVLARNTKTGTSTYSGLTFG